MFRPRGTNRAAPLARERAAPPPMHRWPLVALHCEDDTRVPPAPSGTAAGAALRAPRGRAHVLRGVARCAALPERGRQRRRHGALPREQRAPTVRGDRVPLARARPRRFRAAQRQQDGRSAHVGNRDAQRRPRRWRRRRRARTLQRRRPSARAAPPRKCADVIAASASSRTATIDGELDAARPRAAASARARAQRRRERRTRLGVGARPRSRACANGSPVLEDVDGRAEVGSGMFGGGRAAASSSQASSSLASYRLDGKKSGSSRRLSTSGGAHVGRGACADAGRLSAASKFAAMAAAATKAAWAAATPLPRNRRPWTLRVGGATATCGSSSTHRCENTNHAGLSPACAFRDASIIVQTDEQTLDMFCNWLHHYRQLKLPCEPVYAVAYGRAAARSARATLRTSRSWRRRGWTGSAARAAVLAASARRTLGRAPSTR